MPPLQHCIIFILLVSTTLPCVLSEGIHQWYERISRQQPLGLTHECISRLTKGAKSKDFILQLSSQCCEEEPGFKWGFSIDTGKKLNKKTASLLNGPTKITFDKAFKDGLKLGICIKTFREDIRSIEGTFVNNFLQGEVRIDFESDESIIGISRDSRLLVEPLRYFDSHGRLFNITFKDFNLYSNKNNNFVIIQDGGQNIVLHRGNDNNKNTVLTCFTKDPMSNVHHGCMEADVELDSPSCLLDIKMDVTKLDSKAFSLNLITMQWHFEGENILPHCSEKWIDGESAKGELSSWLKNLESIESDPYWRIPHYKEALGDNDGPSVRVEIPEWNRDSIHSDFEVYAFGKDFGVTKNNDGIFELKLSAVDLKDMDFTSPLMIISSNKIGLRPGIYFEDKDDGNTIDELAQRISLIGYLRNGKLNGVVRRYGRFSTDPDHQCKKPIFQGISFIGHYENGVPSGPSWRVVPGGGLLYGTTEDMEFTGENLAYIYPDLETAIIGRFKKGLLVEGREAKLERVRCVNGIYEAQFSEPDGPSYHYRRPTNATFGDQPHLPDPLDKKYFTVKSSTIDHPLSSEGAFAIRDISAGTLMALYSGIILSNEEKKVFNERYETENRAKGLDISEDEAHAYYKYHITLKGCKHIITVPFEKTSLDEIKSTMGHKVNHSFEPNCEIGDLLDTPRQGIIMTLSTLRDIKKGEELFINYNYKAGNVPPWYRVLYEKTYGYVREK